MANSLGEGRSSKHPIRKTLQAINIWHLWEIGTYESIRL